MKLAGGPPGVTVRVVCVVALVSAVITAAAVLASAPTHAPGSPQPTDPPRGAVLPEVQEYVALGDSYTAGPFVAQAVPALGCFRSTHNYPAKVAAALDVETLVDVSCSGADTTDMTSRQHTGFATVPAQLRALSPRTDLVTVGVGGNDAGVFGSLVSVCADLRATDPDGSPCREHFSAGGGRNVLLAATAGTRRRVQEVLERVHRRAPGARVLVVGYPRIAPRGRTCPAVLPFAEGDYAYADRVERRLNASLRAAARSEGAGYVDTYRASRGHDACAGPEAWVNGQQTLLGRAMSYHPLRSYMRAVADLVVQRLRR
jgi:lysophospholipase L1-like esterase